MKWLMGVLRMFNLGHQGPSLIDHAIAHAQVVGGKADRLSARLDAYLNTPDPFKAFATDVFERQQESNIHRGPPR